MSSRPSFHSTHSRCQVARNGKSHPWGLQLIKPPSCDTVEVRHINSNGAISQSPLSVGDRITSVNGRSLRGLKFEEIEEIFSSAVYVDIEFTSDSHDDDNETYDFIFDDDDNESFYTPVVPSELSLYSSSHEVIDLVSDDDGVPDAGTVVVAGGSSRGTVDSCSDGIVNLVSDDEDIPPPTRMAAPAGLVLSSSPWKRPHPASASVSAVPMSVPPGTISSSPLAKRRRIPLTEHSGVKDTTTVSEKVIKREGVGFGCADIVDEVVEVRNPQLNQSISSAPAPAVVDMETEDECVEYVGGNMTVASDMPHQREACTKYSFVLDFSPSLDSTRRSGAVEANRLHCSKCYCYLCEVPAEECRDWVCHCCATHKIALWRGLRVAMSSPLLRLLPPVACIRVLTRMKNSQVRSESIFGEPRVNLVEMNNVVEEVWARVAEHLHPTSAGSDSSSDCPFLPEIPKEDYLEALATLVAVIKKCAPDITMEKFCSECFRILAAVVLLSRCCTAPFAPPESVSASCAELSSIVQRVHSPGTRGLILNWIDAIQFLVSPVMQTNPNWVWCCPSHLSELISSDAIVPLACTIYDALVDVNACGLTRLEFSKINATRGTSVRVKCFLSFVSELNISLASECIMTVGYFNQLNVYIFREGLDKLNLLHLCVLMSLIQDDSFDFDYKPNFILMVSNYILIRTPRHELQDFLRLRNGGTTLGGEMMDTQAILNKFDKQYLTRPSEWVKLYSDTTKLADDSILHLAMALVLNSPAFCHKRLKQVEGGTPDMFDQILFDLGRVLPHGNAELHLVIAYFIIAHGNLGEEISESIRAVAIRMAIHVVISRLLYFQLSVHEVEVIFRNLPKELYTKLCLNRIPAENYPPLRPVGESVEFSQKDKSYDDPGILKPDICERFCRKLGVVSRLLSSNPELKRDGFAKLFQVAWCCFVSHGAALIRSGSRACCKNVLRILRIVSDLEKEFGSDLEALPKGISELLIVARLQGTREKAESDVFTPEAARGIRVALQASEHIPNGNVSKLWSSSGECRWGFWQRLLLEMYIDMNPLSRIIMEDWSFMYRPVCNAVSLVTSFVSSFPTDIASSREHCEHIWFPIIKCFKQSDNSGLLVALDRVCEASRPTALDTMIYFYEEAMIDILIASQSPCMFRVVRRCLRNCSEPKHPLHSQHSHMQALWTNAVEKVQTMLLTGSSKGNEAFRRVRLAAILGNNFLMSQMLKCALPNHSDESAKFDNTHIRLLVDLLKTADSAQDVVFVSHHIIDWVRRLVSPMREMISNAQVVIPDTLSLLESNKHIVVEILALLQPSRDSVIACLKNMRNVQYDEETYAVVMTHMKRTYVDGVMEPRDYLYMCKEFFDCEEMNDFFSLLLFKNQDPLCDEGFLKECFSVVAECSVHAHSYVKAILTLQWIAALAISMSEYDNAFRQSLFEGISGLNWDFLHAGIDLDEKLVYLRCIASAQGTLLKPHASYLVLVLLSQPSVGNFTALAYHDITAETRRKLLLSTFNESCPDTYVQLAANAREFAHLFSSLRRLCVDVESAKRCIQLAKPVLVDCMTRPITSQWFISGGCLTEAIPWLVRLKALSDTMRDHPGNEELKSDFEDLLKTTCRQAPLCVERLMNCVAAFRANNISNFIDSLHSLPAGENGPVNVFESVTKLCECIAFEEWSFTERILKFVEFSQMSVMISEPFCRQCDCFCRVLCYKQTWHDFADTVLKSSILDSVCSIAKGMKFDPTKYESELSRFLPLVDYVVNNEVWAAESMVPYLRRCIEYFSAIVYIGGTSSSDYYKVNIWARLVNAVNEKARKKVEHLQLLCAVAHNRSIGGYILKYSDFSKAAACAQSCHQLELWLESFGKVMKPRNAVESNHVLSFLFAFPKVGEFDGRDQLWDSLFNDVRNTLDSSKFGAIHAICALGITQNLIERKELEAAIASAIGSADVLKDYKEIFPLLEQLLGLGQIGVDKVNLTVLTAVRSLVSERVHEAKRQLFGRFIREIRCAYLKHGRQVDWKGVYAEGIRLLQPKKKVQEVLKKEGSL